MLSYGYNAEEFILILILILIEYIYFNLRYIITDNVIYVMIPRTIH